MIESFLERVWGNLFYQKRFPQGFAAADGEFGLDKLCGLADYHGMQRVGAVIDVFNKDIAKVLKLRGMWPEIAGEVLAAHTAPTHVQGAKLFIVCDAPVWVQQIDILSTTLCAQIKKITGTRIKVCEGRFGVLPSPAPPKRKHAPALKPEIDPETVAGIRDPELKQHVKALLEIEGGSDD